MKSYVSKLKKKDTFTDVCALPASIMEDIICNCVVVEALNLRHRAVYNAIVEIHTQRRSIPPQSIGPSNPVMSRPAYHLRCRNCKSTNLDEMNDGTIVCCDCGAICDATFQDTECHVKVCDDDILCDFYAETISHWAPYCNVDETRIDQLVRLALASNGYASKNVIVAAVLIMSNIQLPDSDELTLRMRAKHTIQEPSSTIPSPTFACPKCKAMLFNCRDARLHCKASVYNHGLRKKRRSIEARSVVARQRNGLRRLSE